MLVVRSLPLPLLCSSSYTYPAPPSRSTAYLGAAALITNPAYLTAAASILTTESRHQAYISTVDQSAPWSGAFDTPQSLDNVYSLAAGFITSCPEGNAKLPVKAFPKCESFFLSPLFSCERGEAEELMIVGYYLR